MKPGRLYIKTVLWFLLVLCITEILIFGLFIIGAEKGLRPKLHHFVSGHVQLAKEMVEDKIRLHPNLPLNQNEALKDSILYIGAAYGAKAWLTEADGKEVIKSFREPVPHQLVNRFDEPISGFKSFKLFHSRNRGRSRWDFYAIIPIALHREEAGKLHILFQKKEDDHHWRGFAIGLIIIGLIIAILIMPLTRLITKRVKLLRESAIRISQGDLSHRATVRGKDEIGDLGRSFNLMADRVERMVQGGKELTANVSHELRTPLARIRVAEELLRKKIKDHTIQDWERHLNDIQEDIEQMDLLIGKILLFSKMDLKDKPLNRQPVIPAALMEMLITRLKSTIEQKTLNVLTEMDFSVSCQGDPDALQTALSNILDNAVKFTKPKGRIRVTISADSSGILISITNAFGKLSQEELERIFEPFYRAKGNTTPGTGLGLAISKKIIEKHDGTLTARNAEEGLELRIRMAGLQ